MIRIICVGKIKESFYNDALNEYKKRISKYTKLEIIEVADECNGNILEKEYESINKHIGNKDYVICLDINGEELSSIDLASKLDELFIYNSNITFIIGGSLGLDDRIKKRSNYSLSFSKMTFPHQLFRVILLEQIYRSFKIINNETYHK